MEDQQGRRREHQQSQRLSQTVSSSQSVPSQQPLAAYSRVRRIAASPASQPDLDRGEPGQAIASYGYASLPQYSQQLPDQALQYSSEFGTEGNRMPLQPYPPNVLYNLASPVPQQTGYDAVAQFNPRESSAVEMLPNQFNVSQYFASGEHTSRSAQHSPTYATSSYQQAAHFPHREVGTHSPTSSQYMGGVADVSSTNTSIIMDPPGAPHQRRNTYDAYSGFYDSLRQVLHAVNHNDLLQAGNQILQLSDWVAGQAVELGLTRDDEVPYEHRLDFWENFNLCWLALLQRQKDNSQQMISRGQHPTPGQAILQVEVLERMARELVRMCDGLERHGLVDYQMGVWEEEIMNVLLECLNFLESDSEHYGISGVPPARSQTAGT